MDPLTLKQWKKYNKASRCHICFKQFGDSKKGSKVRDHCRYTGRYRGPAHRNCNLMYRIPSYIPVVFHNLSGYDAHLFIRELGRHSRDTMEVVAKNKEDNISFSVKVAVNKYVDKLGNEKDKFIELRFIDSFKFMATSLDSLTRNLVGADGLAWKACLKKTGVRLEVLTDPDMLLMFERGIRGGITQAVHRYA